MGEWAYLLRCADESYYAGSTSHEDVEARVWEHNNGVYGGYTSSHGPVSLVWAEWFEDLRDAHATERRLKGWSRAKKEALIARDYAKLPILAKRCGGRSACFEAPLRGAPQHDDVSVRHADRTEQTPNRHPEVLVSRASKE